MAAISPALPADLAEELAQKLRAAKLQEDAIAAHATSREAWRELEKVYEALATQNPASADVRLARGDFRWNIGERGRATDDWREAERLEPNRAGATARLAQAALALGDTRAAADGFTHALSIEPDNPALHFDLANVFFLFRHELSDGELPTADDRMHEALKHFATATKLAPTNEGYAKAYAETFYAVANPDWSEALRAWEHVRALGKSTDFALLNLARVHLKLRQIDASRRCLERVQSPSHQRLKKLIAAQLDAFPSPVTSREPAAEVRLPPSPGKSPKPDIDDRPQRP